MSTPLRRTLSNLIDESARQNGKPLGIKLGHGLRISLRVFADYTHLLLARDETYPSDTEYKTVLAALPYPPSPWPWPPQRLRRNKRFCIYAKWPTVTRLIDTIDQEQPQ
jgi:hypothetical protein